MLAASATTDSHHEQLLVRDRAARRVIGGFRLLTPQAARRSGGYALEADFDLAALDVLRERMLEAEWLVVDPACPVRSVQPLLWAELARFMLERGFDFVLGSVAVGAADGGHVAASLHRASAQAAISPDDLRIRPRRALPVDRLRDTLPVKMPALLRGYLDRGAWICGEPAWDCGLERARLPLLLSLARMRGRAIRHFLAAAA